MTRLQMRLWSADAPDFESENMQLLQIIDTIGAATHKRGVYVMDWGADRMKLFSPLLARGLRFIVCLVGDRYLCYRNRLLSAQRVAAGCPTAYTESLIKQDAEGEHHLLLHCGIRPVCLPDHPEPLYLVVVRGLGQEPLMLLTKVALHCERRSFWYVVQGYLTRRLVEETIRFIKRSYHFEDLRVLHYEQLRNQAALVLAAAYFAAVWLGESLKLAVLTTCVTQAAKRLFGVPDFHYYALADGLAVLFTRPGRCQPISTSPPPSLAAQLGFH